MKRIQFSCSANRPASRGLAGENQDDEQERRVWRPRSAGDPSAAVEQGGPGEEPEEDEQRQRDEPGQSFEHDRRERHVAGTDVLAASG